jgi:NitT/TauT family transport system permease protein
MSFPEGAVAVWKQAWSAIWPKLSAIALALMIWQLVALSGWRPEWVLPHPQAVLQRLVEELVSGEVARSTSITMLRAATGFALAVIVGSFVGMVLLASRRARTGVGSLLTGVQTLPSVAWFPLAILLFQLSEGLFWRW